MWYAAPPRHSNKTVASDDRDAEKGSFRMRPWYHNRGFRSVNRRTAVAWLRGLFVPLYRLTARRDRLTRFAATVQLRARVDLDRRRALGAVTT